MNSSNLLPQKVETTISSTASALKPEMLSSESKTIKTRSGAHLWNNMLSDKKKELKHSIKKKE